MKAQRALKECEKFLEICRKEVVAREKRVEYLRTTLEQGEDGDRDSVIGFKIRVPALPRRPMVCQSRAKAQKLTLTKHSRADGRKMKRSTSPAPHGVKCLAYGRTEIVVLETERWSRMTRREWVRSGSVTRRRSESCPPSAARVERNGDKHRSLGRASKNSIK